MTGARRRHIAVIALIAGLLTGFSAWWSAMAREQAVQASAPMLVPLGKPMNAGAARMLGDALLDDIRATPLNQRLVNRFYTLAVVNGLVSPAALDAWRTQLAALGWRDTAALQNLLLAAGQNADLAEVLDLTDAFLRRKKLVEQVGNVLYIIEQEPQVHGILLRRLKTHVPWRTSFLTDPHGLITPKAIAARRATINELLASRNGVTRAEIAPLLNAMASAGQEAAAYPLWQRFRARSDGDSFVPGASFDPNFTRYRAVTAPPAARDVPFEWQALSGDGFSADIGRDGVALHWDGSGVPVLLRQTFRAVPGRYELRLRGPDATPDFLNRFEVAAVCPDGETLFTQAGAPVAGWFTASADRPVSCTFPTLLVRARATMVPQSIDASLTAVVLRPVRG